MRLGAGEALRSDVLVMMIISDVLVMMIITDDLVMIGSNILVRPQPQSHQVSLARVGGQGGDVVAVIICNDNDNDVVAAIICKEGESLQTGSLDSWSRRPGIICLFNT